MLLGKVLCILSFSVVSFTSRVHGLDWPWNWKREDVTCYTTCLAAVGTGAVVATPLAISAAGFSAAGIVGGSFAANIMSMIGVEKAGGWFAFLKSDGVTGDRKTGIMEMASAVFPLCAAICGSKEEDLKCNTHRIDGMKGLDENVIKAAKVNDVAMCEGLCNDQKDCRAFRYLSKNRFCFVYDSIEQTEDDISESLFYVKRCVLCYMNTTKNAKGSDDEIGAVFENSSLKECENSCIKSEDCSAVHFDGKRCFKFTDKVKPYKKTGIDFSRKICVQFTD